MSLFRGGTLLLLLGVPFALYILWQVQAGARADFGAAPPAEKAPPDGKKNAEAKKFANDVRQMTAVALQYRAPGPDDKTESADCTAVAKAVAVRANDLADLEKFLSGADKPVYAGALKDRYTEWQVNKQKLAKMEAAVEAWLKNPLPVVVDGAAVANQTMKTFEDMIAEYRKDSTFADTAKALVWQVEARVKVLESLEAAAHRPYDEVLAFPLPLPDPKTNKQVEKALGAPIAMREQARLLDAELLAVRAAKAVLPERVSQAANNITRQANEWAAKEELLALFADPELFTNPNKATDWLPKVLAQFNRTQTTSGRDLIRKKVQQFCEAAIPRAAKLDAEVLVAGKERPRVNVRIIYQAAGKPKVERSLTDHPVMLNEFNFQTLHPDFDQVVWPGGLGWKDSLKPTLASLAAREFTTERTTVTLWTPATVERLKKKCEGADAAVQQKRREQFDRLAGAETVREPLGMEPKSMWTPENSRIWTRLTALSEAMTKAPGLFEGVK